MRAVADRCALAERDKRRQILILGPQRVTHPRADRREAGKSAAGDERELRRRVIDPVGGHRPDERYFVYHLLEVRQEIGDLPPALAALLELPWTGHDLLRTVEGAPLDLERRRFAVILPQCGLRIEHIDGARPASDVNEDDALGLGGEVRWLRFEIVYPLLGERRLGCEQAVLLEHRIHGHG